jgi:hypothetical protein
VEPKPKKDLLEEALMVSLEEMAQPSFDVEHFIEEEDEFAESIELDQNEKPPPPSI